MDMNADPVELTLEIDAITRRVKRITARMLEVGVYTPNEIPEPEPHRWPRVIRRWASKHAR